MKSTIFFIGIFLLSTLIHAEEMEFVYGYQKTESSSVEKNNIAPCRKYWGEGLVSCMETKLKNRQELMQNLYYLDNSGQREAYFAQTLKSSEDYAKLAKVLTEEDWQLLWDVMNKAEKERFFKNSSGVVASSKDNLEAFIKDKQYYENVYYYTKLGVVVVVGGGVLVFTPAGPAILTGVAKVGTAVKGALGAKGAAVAAGVAA